MIVGVPKEIKNNEFRVGMTPSGANSFINNGHRVLIQKDAGIGSGYKDLDYSSVGAEICETIEEVYAKSEMIVKVKEPLKSEYSLIKENQIVYTYFHFASSEELTKAMIDTKSICIAYETVQNKDLSLPLLTPMSEVAGRMATQEGAKFLEKPQGGFGILLGGVAGVKPANVMVIGGGIAGTEAALMAAGLGANVTIFDTNLDRLRYLEITMPSNVTPIYSNPFTLEQEIQTSHLIIGTVLIPGSKAPKLITKKMLNKMMPGTVLVDVAIDQGGCFETSEPTTHDDPVVIKQGIIHYAVTNMPGAVPNTSTTALTNATLNFALELANKGWKTACLENEALRKGLNIINGRVVYKEVAEVFNLDHINVSSLIKN